MRKGEKRPDLYRARVGVCPVCGKEYRAVKDFKGRKQVYCSKECWRKRAIKINYCKYCGKEIVTSNKRDKQYCDSNCRNKDYINTHKGALSHFWQGGKTKISKIRRTNAEYRKWRNDVFTRDNFTCQNCGAHTSNLEAHHIKGQSRYPELIYDINNGVTLCHECHKLTDNYGYKAQRTE